MWENFSQETTIDSIQLYTENGCNPGIKSGLRRFSVLDFLIPNPLIVLNLLNFEVTELVQLLSFGDTTKKSVESIEGLRYKYLVELFIRITAV